MLPEVDALANFLLVKASSGKSKAKTCAIDPGVSTGIQLINCCIAPV